ncbi:2OG-Fe(II) oxygenase [Novosphingobium barchaimii LL02]|uniref:2OG-Fe(II) oxygenase n=1 Tax=Novosphingobium barchaimii LL02 TaxID=1114963 RepID=A0A0J8A6U5_9SPHN|nr:2OG-Fe(II) oxygenase [Novosphingobium barchaimii]KMS51110.1 2OG-Fe(II) oxygenase [Novosphingobium barchaimii LL02]
MQNIWEVWSDALTEAECDAIAARAEHYAPAEATIGFSDALRSDKGYRTSTIRWLDTSREKDIVGRIMDFVRCSNRTNFGVDVEAPFELQYTEYRATNKGHYDWHQDVWLESPRPYARKLSVVVQLSSPDEYKGGGFEFFGIQNPGATFLGRGSLLIFPSFLQHRVLPVTDGLRRSLVTWIEGPNWR